MIVCPPPESPSEDAVVAAGRPGAADRTGVRSGVGLGPGLGALGAGPSGHAPAREQIRDADRQRGRPLDLPSRGGPSGVQRLRGLADGGPIAAGHEPRDGRLRHVDSRAPSAGPARHDRLEHRPDATGLGTAISSGSAADASSRRRRLVTSEQIRLVAYTAIAAGSRGLLFESRSSLDDTDPETRARAAALELLNLELELIRPWVAAGNLVDTVQSTPPEVSGAVFRYNRTRLLVPLWTGLGAQFVPGQSAGQTLRSSCPACPTRASPTSSCPADCRRSAIASG